MSDSRTQVVKLLRKQGYTDRKDESIGARIKAEKN